MPIASLATPLAKLARPAPESGPWQASYRQLLAARPGAPAARAVLETSLEEAAQLPCALPEVPAELPQWSRQHTAQVGAEYAAYLAERHAGGPRRYFAGRAQALYFLRAVAPTKEVDGAWLYGCLPYWRDLRLQPLVRTYLEELGDGLAAQNHVLLYRRLLAAQGCEQPGALDDELYRQGAIQLALGLQAEAFLPEVIGYNLGYEQLPLHLLISAYELKELGIDPYYFQLHVTIDNAASGHAAKAVQSVLDNLPQVGDAEDFYRRVRLGYRLNDLGSGSCAVIAGFDLQQELLRMLEGKRPFAAQAHSDHCRIGGRTVNQWLAAPEGIEAFLDALQRHGWIRRQRDPSHSRFWRLVEGEGAAMFGVFTPYERQLLHDWIAGDQAPALSLRRAPHKEVLSLPAAAAEAPLQENERQALSDELKALPPAEREARLIELLAPAHHPSVAGLAATRLFSALLQQAR
ncbi:iron-containing redox enzyme family protein [Pseudomonas sp. NCHU5208]|uniref:iron-containing redox enzyme family protein n=1 Tax=unclassified Pseudomonas TaxID=196821 RepID=UPI003F9C9EAD